MRRARDVDIGTAAVGKRGQRKGKELTIGAHLSVRGKEGACLAAVAALP
jgi:hypothetical protein